MRHAQNPLVVDQPGGHKSRTKDPMFASLEQVAEYEVDRRAPIKTEELEWVDELALAISREFRTNARALPAFPATAQRALEMVVDPSVEIGDYIQLANHDPSTAAEILRASNSAAFSRGVEVATVRDAVIRLGIAEVANVVAVTTSRALFNFKRKNAYQDIAPLWHHVWTHSVTSAYAALWLSVSRRAGDSKKAFLGGLLHDIGKIGVLGSLSTLIARGNLEDPPTPRVLHALLEELHVALGTEMAHSWHLPRHVIDICTEHHELEPPGDVKMYEVHAVRVVSGVNQMRINPIYRKDLELEIDISARALGLQDDFLAETVDHIREFAEKSHQLYA